MRENQSNQFDISKAIGIIFIVFGHARMPEHVWSFVSFFHVPLFFFISGYFYKDEYFINPKSFLSKRLKSLYIPLVKYEMFFLIFHNLFFKLNIYNEHLPIGGVVVSKLTFLGYVKCIISILLFGSTEPIIWGFWFIQCLFLANIYFVLIGWLKFKFFSNDENFRFIVIAFVALLGFCLAEKKIYLPRSMVSSFVSLMYLYFGYLFRTHRNLVRINIFGSVVFFSVLFVSVSLYGEHVGFASHEFVRFPYYIMNSLAGIYLVFYISDRLMQNKLCVNLFCFIGRNTFHILAMHMISFKLVSLALIVYYKYPIEYLAKFPVISSSGIFWLAYGLTGVMVPVIIRYVYLSAIDRATA